MSRVQKQARFGVGWSVLLSGLSFLCVAPPNAKAGPQQETQRITVPRVDHPPAVQDFAQMKPDEAFRGRMARIEGFIQRSPREGEPASQRTEVYLGFDSENLYAIFLCFDSDPSQIRAHLTPREKMFADDHVMLYLDTFRDRRHAYIFVVNPLAIQADGVSTEGQGEDFSFDTLWYSEGIRTPQGYLVRMAIPFKSLRFAETPGQIWGITVSRIIPRSDEVSYWPQESTRLAGFVPQFAELDGLSDVTPGRNMQFIPYGSLRSFRALDQRDPNFPRFSQGSAKLDAGLDAKIVLKNTFVLDAAIEPDFNQVESDDPQVTVNQRFEVFFPEKRPFFLENSNYFQTPINVLFTRRIADPQFGIRMTGKLGPYSLAGLWADDRSPGETVPPGDPLFGKRAWFAAARVNRDLSDQSSLGLIFVDREFNGSFNRVGGLDGRVKLSDAWVARFQGVESSTQNLDGSYLAGPALSLGLSRSGRSLGYSVDYEDRSTGFQALSGYVPRTDIRDVNQSFQYSFYPENKALLSWGPVVSTSYILDHEGNTLNQAYAPQIQVHFPGQTYIGGGFIKKTELLRPVDFPVLNQNREFSKETALVYFGTGYLNLLNLQFDFRQGQGVNYAPPVNQEPFSADQSSVTATLTLRPAGPLQIDNTYLLTTMRDSQSGAGIFDNQIWRSKWNIQFSRELSLRFIAQSNKVLSNARFTSLDTTKDFNADLLLTYLLNPGTAFYVGYNTNLQNLNPALIPTSTGLLRSQYGMMNDSRQLFVKISYSFRF